MGKKEDAKKKKKKKSKNGDKKLDYEFDFNMNAVLDISGLDTLMKGVVKGVNEGYNQETQRHKLDLDDKRTDQVRIDYIACEEKVWKRKEDGNLTMEAYEQMLDKVCSKPTEKSCWFFGLYCNY